MSPCGKGRRRGFVKADTNDPAALVVLNLIAKLYAIEAQAEAPGRETGLPLVWVRREFRNRLSRPLIERLRT